MQKFWGIHLLIFWTFLSLYRLLPLCSVYSPLCLDLGPGSSFGFWFVLLKAVAQKSITEVGCELAELVEQLIDIVRSLQSQRHLPESGPDNERSTPSMSVVGLTRRGKRVLGTGLGTASSWSHGNMLGIEGCNKSSSFTIFLLSHMDDQKCAMLEVR